MFEFRIRRFQIRKCERFFIRVVDTLGFFDTCGNAMLQIVDRGKQFCRLVPVRIGRCAARSPVVRSVGNGEKDARALEIVEKFFVRVFKSVGRRSVSIAQFCLKLKVTLFAEIFDHF